MKFIISKNKCYRSILSFSNDSFNGTIRVLRIFFALLLDKVRFLSPVKVGSNLRGSFKLLEVTPSKSGYKIKNELTIEIEGEEKPACVAETLGVLYPSE